MIVGFACFGCVTNFASRFTPMRNMWFVFSVTWSSSLECSHGSLCSFCDLLRALFPLSLSLSLSVSLSLPDWLSLCHSLSLCNYLFFWSDTCLRYLDQITTWPIQEAEYILTSFYNHVSLLLREFFSSWRAVFSNMSQEATREVDVRRGIRS